MGLDWCVLAPVVRRSGGGEAISAEPGRHSRLRRPEHPHNAALMHDDRHALVSHSGHAEGTIKLITCRETKLLRC